MTPSFFSLLDLDARRLIEDKRRLQERAAYERLALLAHLRGRYIECNLPREAETRVEQSFNELLFRGVLGYPTLFSHGALPFHLRPKTSAGGKYDDFSLGFFFGEPDDQVIASAELKSAGCSLDAPQTGRRERLSPIEQALRTAKLIPGCRFALVSNFRELRLYTVADDLLVAAVDLLEVRDAQQLAFLSAHFDRRALLGDQGHGDIMNALDTNHPALPVAAAEGAYRIVLTFSPGQDTGTPLFVLHDKLRLAAVDRLGMVRRASPHERKEAWKGVQLDIREGWAVVRSSSRALAVSTAGQVRYSVRRHRQDGGAQVHPDVEFWSLVDDLVTFLSTVLWIHEEEWKKEFWGGVSVSLREVQSWSLYFDGKSGLLQRDYNQNAGVCREESLSVGPYELRHYAGAPVLLATALSELGLYFMGNDESRLRFDHSKLAQSVAKQFPLPDAGQTPPQGGPR